MEVGKLFYYAADKGPVALHITPVYRCGRFGADLLDYPAASELTKSALQSRTRSTYPVVVAKVLQWLPILHRLVIQSLCVANTEYFLVLWVSKSLDQSVNELKRISRHGEWILPKPDKYMCGILVNRVHVLDLSASLRLIILVDAELIYPQVTRSVTPSKSAQRILQIWCKCDVSTTTYELRTTR